jgi:hypothetical protein
VVVVLLQFKVLILYLAQLLPLVVVRAEVIMALVHLVVLVAQEAERLVLTLAAVLVLAHLVKVLLVVLQRQLEQLVEEVAAEQAQ